MQSPALPCCHSQLSHRFFLRCFEASNLRVGGSNPSRRAIENQSSFNQLGELTIRFLVYPCADLKAN